MIDSIVEKNFSKKRTLTYPYIGRLNEKITMYVLFTKPRSGVLLAPGTELENMGTFSNCWDEHNFSYTEDVVTLRNR